MTIAELQAQQIRAEGHEPVLCGACGWPGHVIEEGERSALVQHLGRGFPCRTDRTELIAPTAAEALEDLE